MCYSKKRKEGGLWRLFLPTPRNDHEWQEFFWTMRWQHSRAGVLLRHYPVQSPNCTRPRGPTESEQPEEQGTSQAPPSSFPICPPTALPLNQIMPQAVCITWTKLLKAQKNIGGNHASWFKSSLPGKLGLLLFLLSWTSSTFVYLTSVLRFFHLYLVMKIKALKTGPGIGSSQWHAIYFFRNTLPRICIICMMKNFFFNFCF